MTRHEFDLRINKHRRTPSVAEGIELVSRAREYALKAHGTQKYSEHPYSYHLEAVVDVLIEFDYIESVFLAGGWLHDVVEDTNISYADLRLDFPGHVANIVSAVTDEPDKNRKERKAKTYPKIAAEPMSIPVKLADRIANVRETIKNNDSMFKMYQKEYQEFRDKLYPAHDTRILPMWWALDRLLDYQGT